MYSIYGRKGLAWAIDQVEGYYIVIIQRASPMSRILYTGCILNRCEQNKARAIERKAIIRCYPKSHVPSPTSQVPRPKSKKQHRREESYVPDTHHASRLLKDHPPSLPPGRFRIDTLYYPEYDRRVLARDSAGRCVVATRQRARIPRLDSL